MPTLHVRDVPDALYQRLQALAEEGRRSLSAEVIELLSRAVAVETARRRFPNTLAAIQNGRVRRREGAPDTVELLREDRGR